MISGQKCSLEAELVAGKFGNPTLLTIVQCTLGFTKIWRFHQKITEPSQTLGLTIRRNLANF